MAKGITVRETEYTSRRDVERFYSDDEIAELFPDGDGSLVSPLLRRAQAAEAEVERLRDAITAGGFDLSPCRMCGRTIVCVPDGLALCESCAKDW